MSVYGSSALTPVYTPDLGKNAPWEVCNDIDGTAENEGRGR